MIYTMIISTLWSDIYWNACRMALCRNIVLLPAYCFLTIVCSVVPLFHGMMCYFYNNDIEGTYAVFTDGGCADYCGVIALLRRKVRKILFRNACNSDVLLDINNGAINANHRDTMALFGVFERKEWEESFKMCRDEGRPYVHKAAH
jgi:hypothetical protein